VTARYISQSIEVEAVQWTGGNLAEVQAFAGADFISENAGRVWVRNTAGPCEILAGYWLTRRPGEALVMTSPAAWARHRYTKVPA
jgi:hypothetical protein